ncbi:15754_t:CDS:2, partial [Funneliformis caledonium]
KSGQYYEQQSPVPNQQEQLSLNYVTLSNALSTQLEGKPEKRKPKDDRNLTKVWDTKAWDKKDVIYYRYERGKIHPDMKLTYLVNDVWWEEPVLVQQENAYTQLYEMLDIISPSSY